MAVSQAAKPAGRKKAAKKAPPKRARVKARVKTNRSRATAKKTGVATKKKKLLFLDSDKDNLTDRQERLYGTNPCRADSDQDGLSDYEEIKIYRTNPLDPDTDKDGVSDGEEVRRGTNPRGPGRLKDLFIPHEGNNYQPHFLRPKRMIWHGLMAVVIKLVVMAFVIAMPISAWLTPDLAAEQAHKIIDLTNAIRKNLNLNSLNVNSVLMVAAADKAQDMVIGQYFAHLSPDNKGLSYWLYKNSYAYSMAGENLAMGFSGAAEVVNGWTKSKTHYANIVDPVFKDIGVGVVTGSYKNYETTFVAQFFGVTKADSLVSARENSDVATVATGVAMVQPVSQIGASPNAPKVSGVRVINIDQTPPAVDQSRSVVYVAEAYNDNQKIVRAEVYLSDDTREAQINFGNYQIKLLPDEQDPQKWTGSTLIFKQSEEQIFNPVVLPSITATDKSGNTMTADINWGSIVPIKPSIISQYFYIKDSQSPHTKWLFGVSSIYYQILLAVVILALLFNIFIKIKIQRPRLIISGALLTLILMLLLWL